MNVSIWQQFSSNHSADFTVVGVFENPSAAKRAATQVNQILIEIQKWYQNPDNADIVAALDEGRPDQDPFPPTPLEVDIGDHYGFDWDTQSPDLVWYQYSSDVTQAVVVLDNSVIVENYSTGQRTWSGSGPMTRLLQHLGGQPFTYDGTTGESFCVELTCLAPDQSVATAICETYWAALKGSEDARARAGILYSMSAEWCDASTCDDSRMRFQVGPGWLLAEDLPKLLNYFRERGCTEIQYSFISTSSEK